MRIDYAANLTASWDSVQLCILSGRLAAQEEEDMEIADFVKNKKVAVRTIGAIKLKFISTRTLEPAAKETKLTTATDYELPYSISRKIVDKLEVSKDVEKSMEKSHRGLKKALEA